MNKNLIKKVSLGTLSTLGASAAVIVPIATSQLNNNQKVLLNTNKSRIAQEVGAMSFTNKVQPSYGDSIFDFVQAIFNLYDSFGQTRPNENYLWTLYHLGSKGHDATSFMVAYDDYLSKLQPGNANYENNMREAFMKIKNFIDKDVNNSGSQVGPQLDESWGTYKPNIQYHDDYGFFIANANQKNFVVQIFDTNGNEKHNRDIAVGDMIKLFERTGDEISEMTIDKLPDVFQIPRFDSEMNLLNKQLHAEYKTISGPGGEMVEITVSSQNPIIHIPTMFEKLYWIKHINILESYTNKNLVKTEEDVYSSWSTYNYDQIVNPIEFTKTIEHDGKITQIGLSSNIDTNYGEHPLTHVRYEGNNLHWQLMRDGIIIDTGDIENFGKTLLHESIGFWDVISNIFAPISGTIGSIAQGAVGVVVTASSMIKGLSTDPLNELRFWTGASDSYHGSTAWGPIVARDLFGLALPTAFAKIPTIAKWINEITKIPKVVTAISTITDFNETKIQVIFTNLIKGLIGATSVPNIGDSFSKWIVPLGHLIKTLDLELLFGEDDVTIAKNLYEIIDKYGDLTLGQLEKLTTNNNDLALFFALSRYPQVSEDLILQLKKTISTSESQIDLMNNENIAGYTLETPIQVLKGDQLKIVGDFRIQIGANTAGWSLLQPSGYQSEGKVTEESIYLQEQILNGKIFSSEVK